MVPWSFYTEELIKAGAALAAHVEMNPSDKEGMGATRKEVRMKWRRRVTVDKRQLTGGQHSGPCECPGAPDFPVKSIPSFQ